MAAHRYWRAVNLEAYGEGDVELSAFHLLATGVRADSTATLTSNIAPFTGTLATLQDDDLTTAARWPAASVQSIALQWDFGAGGSEVNDIRLAGDSEWRFPLMLKLQWSDDAVAWTDYFTFAGITYPGMGAKTSSTAVVTGDPDFANVASLLHFDGAEGGTAFNDATGKVWTANGAAQLSTTQNKFGGASGKFSGANGTYISTPSSADFDVGTGLFTLEFFLYMTATVNGWTLVGRKLDSTAYSTVQWDLSTLGGGLIFNVSNGLGWINPLPVGATVPLNAWNHIAIVRDGNGSDAIKMYLGGNLYAVSTSNPSLETNAASRPVVIGNSPGLTGGDGYVDEFRFTRGLARYTANFTPPVSAFMAASGTAISGGVFLNKVKGRSAAKPALSVGTGPTIIYGIPSVSTPLYLGVASGAVKDYTTGVLGQGIGRVRGTVKEKGTASNVPVFRKVRLIRERDGLTVREQWSDKITGAYDFTFIDELQTWTVISYDHEHDFRAVIADNLTLANGGVEIMP